MLIARSAARGHAISAGVVASFVDFLAVFAVNVPNVTGACFRCERPPAVTPERKQGRRRPEEGGAGGDSAEEGGLSSKRTRGREKRIGEGSPSFFGTSCPRATTEAAPGVASTAGNAR